MKKLIIAIAIILSVSGATKAHAYSLYSNPSGFYSCNTPSFISLSLATTSNITFSSECNSQPSFYPHATDNNHYDLNSSVYGVGQDISTTSKKYWLCKYTYATLPNFDPSSADCEYGSYVNGIATPDTSLTYTHIISIAPADNSDSNATTSNPVTFSYTAYIAPSDLTTFQGIKMTLYNLDLNISFMLFDTFSSQSFYVLNQSATSSGIFTYSTTTTLAEGNYKVTAELNNTFLGVKNPYARNGGLVQRMSHLFTVEHDTYIGAQQRNAIREINDLFASSTATSTQAQASTCVPFAGFDTIKCIQFLFMPSQKYADDNVSALKDGVLTRFPLGYVTDLVTILSTTTQSSLTVIDAYVPSVLPGHGSHINLSLAHVFDFALNATTGPYMNVSASSTGTLYEITSGYWKIVVYLMAGFYLLGRIIGFHFIPNFKHKSKYVQKHS